MGILEFGGKYIPQDLQLFLKAAGLSSATPEVVVKQVLPLPADQQNDPDSIGETMLDIEVVAGICPKATIAVYFSRWSEKGWVDNLDAVLSDSDAPPILSVSYGLAEGASIWTQQTIDHVNDTLKELANAGMTVCVSTGDDGSDDQVNDGQAHVSFPASSPYVLAVGGTALDRSTGDEIFWFEGDGVRRDQGGSGGGGVSESNPKPTWQTVDIPSVDPSTTSGRIIPDVAADAAGSTGYFMVAQGSPADRRWNFGGHAAVGRVAHAHPAGWEKGRLFDPQAVRSHLDDVGQDPGRRRVSRHHVRQQQVGQLGCGILGPGWVRRGHGMG